MVINFRYSTLLNMIYVTFTHGLALPILFPICFVGIAITYVIESYQLAYFYKKPPMLDNRINDHVLKILKYAPASMMIGSYWYLGNT